MAMCRAVGVRVRLITGRAFNGSEWLDHSWNEIFDKKDGRWVNVDDLRRRKTAIILITRIFKDHRDAEIRGVAVIISGLNDIKLLFPV